MRHIVPNINTSLGRHLSSPEEALVYTLARSDSHETFERNLEKLTLMNSDQKVQAGLTTQ
ncbi:hypothetical protein H257_17249 [Aphanomyces astaci]|uniref:Uncharacterized protein n=1 Tax=Aphanomyces astaci TaxID=112090 RepID=W4FHI0_APHAT|nr:hypothetical protein H257_17249 [Aphanomyces astaci]ETV66281.1 hypothetical protein H257_17249 [Aphanomyces astaci]|eukprot:XP_009844268.1 hypothetical protein H257_17249 [Aphanomyces astaci]